MTGRHRPLLTLTFAHARWMTLELLRQPAYYVATVAFPALFYVIFAVPESKTPEASNYLMASFSGFAFFGVFFLQFGVGLAQERTHSWYQFLKTLPVPPRSFFLARFLTSLFFAILSVAAIVVLALTVTEASMPARDWCYFGLSLMTGGVVFCLMGIALGYWATEKSSLPLGNLIYLPLSFCGGLWKPPEILPDSIKKVSEYLPTRHYGNLLWAAVKAERFALDDFLVLGVYSAIFALIAYWGFRRDMDLRLK